MSSLPSIPEFTEDVASMASALRAMKQAIEVLGGVRAGAQPTMAKVFVQENAPEPARGIWLRSGDFWVNPVTAKLFFWDGQIWVAVA